MADPKHTSNGKSFSKFYRIFDKSFVSNIQLRQKLSLGHSVATNKTKTAKVFPSFE